MLQNSCFIYCNVLLLVYEVSFLVEVAFIHIQTMIHYKFWFCLHTCFEDFSPLLSNCKRWFKYLPHYECFWLFLIKNLNIFIVAWFASLCKMKNVLPSKFLKGKKNILADQLSSTSPHPSKQVNIFNLVHQMIHLFEVTLCTILQRF